MVEGSLYIDQLGKKYNNYLKGVILNEPFVPIELRGGKNKPSTTADLHRTIREFQKYEKKELTNGWRIEWEDWSSKKLGKQQWPKAVYVDTEQDLLFLLKKEKEVSAFKELLNRLLIWNPSVRECLAERPAVILDFADDWQGICAVVDYLLNNDASEYYLRSIPVPVHTKFIERNKPIIFYLLKAIAPGKFTSGSFEEAIGIKIKPFIFPVRWLDMRLADAYTNGMEVIGLTAGSLRKANWLVQKVILVENETTLYMLPQVEETLAICSKGYAIEQLSGIQLFNSALLFYWGDLDEDGFIILHQCRRMYPHMGSILMDNATVKFHIQEMDKQPGKYKKQVLSELHPEEIKAFQLLSESNGRIEQEKLQHRYIQQQIECL